VRWQRWARLLVGVFLVVFTIVVYRAIRPRETPERTVASLPRVDPAATGETAGGVWTFSHGETLRFERLLNYSDGRSRAMAVKLTIPEENGRVVTVTAREAEQQEQKATDLGRVKFSGDVVVTTSDGLRLTTDEAVYDSGDQMVRAPGIVRFARGGMSGSGLGATYDRRRDELWLLDQARVTFAPDEGGAEGLDVTAGAAGMARAEHRIRFERGVHIERTDRDIDALAATVTLTDDESKVSFVELRGDARIARRAALAPPSPGELSSMSARDIDLQYAADGRTLERATLVSGATIALAGDEAGSDRRVAAERLVAELAPDGSTVTALQGQERVDLQLPATTAAPARRIQSATLDARGAGSEGLRSATFGGGVEYRETARGPRSADRVARSTRLDVALQPGFGTIDAATFVDKVSFSDGDWRGQGPSAQYDPAHGRLSLDAGPGATTLPQVADARVTIEGRRINLALDDRRLDAQDRVRSVMQPRESTPGTDQGGHLPALLTEGQPVFVTAARLAYDGSASVAVYSGGARLWQGDTVIQAETISLDDQRGNLSASGKVHSVMTLATASEDSPARAPDRTVADAETLEYEDAQRVATYRTKARLNGPAGDLRGERIELTLAETEGRLERVEAFESVTAVLEAGRYTTTGSHLTYLAPEDRYVVEGAPVRVIERRETECLETVGTILTFLRSTDTISVEGTDGSRSRTRPVPCAERRH
jgi:lipopolysaccharide export system protein LptA